MKLQRNNNNYDAKANKHIEETNNMRTKNAQRKDGETEKGTKPNRAQKNVSRPNE